MESTTQTLKVYYEKSMEVENGDQWNNTLVLNLDHEGGPSVELESLFGNSYTFQSYHNLQFTLFDVPNQTTSEGLEQVVDAIKECEATLIAIYEGFETYWDGSNTRGKLTEEAHELLEGLQRSLENDFAYGLPSFWSADDYFQHLSSREIGKNFMSSEPSTLEEFWENEFKDSTGEFEVKDEDAIRYLRNALKEFVEENLEKFLEDSKDDEETTPEQVLSRAAILCKIVE